MCGRSAPEERVISGRVTGSGAGRLGGSRRRFPKRFHWVAPGLDFCRHQGGSAPNLFAVAERRGYFVAQGFGLLILRREHDRPPSRRQYTRDIDGATEVSREPDCMFHTPTGYTLPILFFGGGSGRRRTVAVLFRHIGILLFRFWRCELAPRFAKI